jgi:hypothetical protein
VTMAGRAPRRRIHPIWGLAAFGIVIIVALALYRLVTEFPWA